VDARKEDRWGDEYVKISDGEADPEIGGGDDG
jgi:hypothetical protein